MKKWFIVSAIVLGAGAAYAQAQPTNAPPTNAQPARAAQSLHAQAPGPTRPAAPALKETRPNEIVLGKLTYSGIAVQAVKAKNPLQLFNPAAPARCGSGLDQFVRYRFSGTGPMLKLFSIDF